MMSRATAPRILIESTSINHRHIYPANLIAIRRPIVHTSKRVSFTRAPVRVRAEGVGSEDAKPVSKEDAARQALLAALGDIGATKKDTLKQFDPAPGGGGGGGGNSARTGGGGGGGGWFGGSGGWPLGGAPLWNSETRTTLQAVAMIFGGLFVYLFWKPMLAIVINSLLFVFRVDPNKGAKVSTGPGTDVSAEEDVINRWGDDEDDEEE